MAKKADGIVTIILGTAQDAGVPQLGCECSNCTRASSDSKYKLNVASLGIINQSTGGTYIIDSTPDIREQVKMLKKAKSDYIPNVKPKAEDSKIGLDGIFLTHAHMGHYMGLVQLGKEAVAASGLPVYSTASMIEFLSANEPFKKLIENKNIIPTEIGYDIPLKIENNLIITPFPVHHRHEFSDAVGYQIKGPNKQLLYMPDVDELNQELVKKISEVDFALIDGTFYNKTELPSHRDYTKVQHPVIIDSIQVFEPYVKKIEIHFTHFNHTNPILNPESEAAKNVKELGFRVAQQEQTFEL